MRLDPTKIYASANYQLSYQINHVTKKYSNAIYDIPNPPRLLFHRKLTLWEKFDNLIMNILCISLFTCVVCGRKEKSNGKELRIVGCTCNNKIGLENDHDFCDIGGKPIVVCYECVEYNKPIFEPMSNLDYLEWLYGRTKTD